MPYPRMDRCSGKRHSKGLASMSTTCPAHLAGSALNFLVLLTKYFSPFLDHGLVFS